MELCDQNLELDLSSTPLAVEPVRITGEARIEPQCLSKWCWAAVTQFLLATYGTKVTQGQVGRRVKEKCLEACEKDSLRRDCNDLKSLGEVLEERDLLAGQPRKPGSMSDAVRILKGIALRKIPVALQVEAGDDHHFAVVSGWIDAGGGENQEHAEVHDPAGGLVRYLIPSVLADYPGWGEVTQIYETQRPGAGPPHPPRVAGPLESDPPAAGTREPEPGWFNRKLREAITELRVKLLLRKLDRSWRGIDGVPPAGCLEFAQGYLKFFFSIAAAVPALEGIDPKNIRICGPVAIANVIKKKLAKGIPGLRLDPTWGIGLYQNSKPFGFLELVKRFGDQWRPESLSFAERDANGDLFVQSVERAVRKFGADSPQPEGRPQVPILVRFPQLYDYGLFVKPASTEPDLPVRSYLSVPLGGAFSFRDPAREDRQTIEDLVKAL